jgi:hypothetical protein
VAFYATLAGEAGKGLVFLIEAIQPRPRMLLEFGAKETAAKGEGDST